MNNQPQEIPLELIDPNPWQTRRVELTGHVEELAHSIRSNGLMQAPVARRAGERFQLAFGHSRQAAFKLLNTLFIDQYPTMPLLIRELNDEQMAIQAFEENEKRKDLNPVEKAFAIRKMIEDFGWTQQQVAEKVHVDRSTVSNMIRMLRMPENVLINIENGVLPVRSAMALLAWYELTELEISAVKERHGGLVDDFVALARNGEVNSDTIRERLSEYLDFLHPTQIALELEPVVVQGDSVTVNDELEARSIEAEIQSIPDEDDQAESFGDDIIFSPEDAKAEVAEEEVTTEEVAAAPATAAVTETATKRAEPAAAAPEPASQDTLFTITWNSGGVFVGLRRPGKAPVVRFLATLTANEIPALLVELGIE
jgi:ParB/RepB/Spo0J family partition protein